jgi:hypothetical protein
LPSTSTVPSEVLAVFSAVAEDGDDDAEDEDEDEDEDGERQQRHRRPEHDPDSLVHYESHPLSGSKLSRG